MHLFYFRLSALLHRIATAVRWAWSVRAAASIAPMELAELVRRHADTLAAVVVEPLVQGAAGMITAPEGYLRRVREATRRHDVLLIADEVAVGFGRTGTMFACTQEDVTPDFLCLAKGLTGGYLPLAATLTTDEVYNAFLGPPEAGRTFYHGHTYTGNPLGAAVALANLDLLQAADGLPALPEKIERLRTHLERLRPFSIVGDIRQRGLMAGIELVRDRDDEGTLCGRGADGSASFADWRASRACCCVRWAM